MTNAGVYFLELFLMLKMGSRGKRSCRAGKKPPPQEIVSHYPDYRFTILDDGLHHSQHVQLRYVFHPFKLEGLGDAIVSLCETNLNSSGYKWWISVDSAGSNANHSY